MLIFLNNHVTEFYKALFYKSANVQPSFNHHFILYATLTDEEGQCLTRRVEYWETTRAIKSIKPHKAPGPDGFHPFFFQKFWHIVGLTIHKIVSVTFQSSIFDPCINETLFMLIPKVERLEVIRQFRPISLCNVIYKVITKVMVFRLKPYMEKIINPLPASFVPGR